MHETTDDDGKQYQYNEDGEIEFELVSRSEMKREMQRLQDLGTELIKLTEEQLEKIPLDPPLKKAIDETKRIKKREALRRHRQLIGKLMRKSDFDAIEAALDKLKEENDAATRLLHTVEQWRDRLIDGDNSELEQFINAFPNTERQQLRQLVRAAKDEKSRKKPPASSRKLFRLLRETIIPSG